MVMRYEDEKDEEDGCGIGERGRIVIRTAGGDEDGDAAAAATAAEWLVEEVRRCGLDGAFGETRLSTDSGLISSSDLQDDM
jgi:hypothetical protein